MVLATVTQDQARRHGQSIEYLDASLAELEQHAVEIQNQRHALRLGVNDRLLHDLDHRIGCIVNACAGVHAEIRSLKGQQR